MDRWNPQKDRQLRGGQTEKWLDGRTERQNGVNEQVNKKLTYKEITNRNTNRWQTSATLANPNNFDQAPS